MSATPRTCHGRFEAQPIRLRYRSSCLECDQMIPAGERVRVWIEKWKWRGNGGRDQWHDQTRFQHFRCPGVLRDTIAEARARRMARDRDDAAGGEM